MYTTVLFDLDGTLLDTLQDLAAACNHALSAMGLPQHAVADYRKMVGNGIPKLIERMLPPDNRGEATLALARQLFDGYYSKHMQDFTAPYPGICAMLDALKAASVRMGVVSNKANEYTQHIVADTFPGIFDAAIGPSEGVPPKPEPAMVQRILEQLGAEPGGTLYVGDSDVDMRTARNAGLFSCGVTWGFRDEDELRAEGAGAIVHAAAELTELILK